MRMDMFKRYMCKYLWCVYTHRPVGMYMYVCLTHMENSGSSCEWDRGVANSD